MSQTVVKPKTKVKPKTARPPLYKVILLNDDYTPREFVVMVLKAGVPHECGAGLQRHDDGAPARRLRDRGVRPDIAETKAKEATELGKERGYPLFFTTEPEE